MFAIARHQQDHPFRGHGVLIWGALAATLAGVLVALQLDLVIALGARIMNPVGQEALARSLATAGLTGLLCWVVCALVTRAITRSALKPWNALADHFERLADGEVDSPLDPRGPEAGVRRLARAAVVFHQRALASQRSEAELQARYDRLCQEQADERRLIMGMLMDRRPDAERGLSDLRSLDGPAPAAFDIPERPAAVADVASGRGTHTGEVVDLAGRLRSAARRVEDRPTGQFLVPDLMPLDFAFIRR